MSISNLLVSNDLKLKAGSLTVAESVDAGRNLTLIPSLDSSGNLQGNSHLSFASNEGVSGIPYITSTATNGEIRLGDNSTSAGIKLFSGSNTGGITVRGDVTANNVSLGTNAVSASHLPIAVGSASWAGGGTSLAVTVNGVTANDFVSVTTVTPSNSVGAVLSHAVPSANTVTIHLETADANNNSVHHYAVYRSLE